MNYGYCPLSVVPGRGEPSDKSEMVTQLLFGESFAIIDEVSNWYNVQIKHDGYECWVDKKQVLLSNDIDKNEGSDAVLVDLLGMAISESDKDAIPLVMGSILPNYDNGRFQLDDKKYVISGNVEQPGDPNPEWVRKSSLKLLNIPYLWGGRSAFGIDCSGLTQLIYRICGVSLPRDSYQQANCGKKVDLFEEALDGDLAFFEKEGRITHVGIILSGDEAGVSEKQIVHASGKVRIDSIDEQGIYDAENDKYTHQLTQVRMVF